MIDKERKGRDMLEKELRESQLSVETLLKETSILKEKLTNVTVMHNS